MFDSWTPQWVQKPEGRQAVSGAAESGSLACPVMSYKLKREKGHKNRGPSKCEAQQKQEPESLFCAVS